MKPCLVSGRRLPNRLAGPPVLLALLVAAGAAVPVPAAAQRMPDAAGPIPVVAAENFYGDVASQIGGGRVEVKSILSDPNVDPHEYESSFAAAKAIFHARLVIENGGGYDAWMNKLLSASPNPARVLIVAYDLAPTKLPDNEHVWYDPDNMLAVARAIRNGLTKLDPAGAADYDRNFEKFKTSLAEVRARMAEIKSRFGGAPIALTETIFQYQVAPTGLKVLTPFSFQKAIAEGTDPPASAAVAAQSQVTGKQVKALIFNRQTADQITTKLRDDAIAAGIPVVGVTETMPPNLHYQSWMLAQLNSLEAALEKNR